MQGELGEHHATAATRAAGAAWREGDGAGGGTGRAASPDKGQAAWAGGSGGRLQAGESWHGWAELNEAEMNEAATLESGGRCRLRRAPFDGRGLSQAASHGMVG